MLNIGISCRITEAINYFELRNSLSVDWIDFFNEINFVPISKYPEIEEVEGIEELTLQLRELRN